MIAQTGLMLADGRYRLVSRIAVGGMGEVWRAHDLAADGPVAIKVLRPEFTGDQTSLKRLRIEARNASLLNHPNITAVRDYREHEGTGYLVMEYVDGQSLADVLAVHATIAPLRLLPILIQSSLGLHAAHSAGVVHRDVKPGNILLGPSDHVKLTDFGISVAHGQLALTDTGKVMGTAQYLAPEQALGNPATPAGDLYSLGVIAYEALAGRRPFGGANYVAIALAQVNEAPPALPGSVEQSLAALVMRLLDKSPSARPSDGAELAGMLGEVLETHRHLAGLLMASRSGAPAPLAPRPVAAGRRAEAPSTAEQPTFPAGSPRPAPEPETDVGPVVPAPADAPGPPPAANTANTADAANTANTDGAADAANTADAAQEPPGGPASQPPRQVPAAVTPARPEPPPAPPPTPGAPTADAAPASADRQAAEPAAEPPAAPAGRPPRQIPAAVIPARPGRPNRPGGLRRPAPAEAPRRTADQASAWPPLTEPGTPPPPLPEPSELAKPLPTPIPARPGPTASGGGPPDEARGIGGPNGIPSFRPSRKPKPGRPKRRGRPPREWIWPFLVGLGLLIIILIGLLTTLNADPPAQGLDPADTTARRVSIVSTVPGLGHLTER
jgi:serine/threonine-protein kinase